MRVTPPFSFGNSQSARAGSVQYDFCFHLARHHFRRQLFRKKPRKAEKHQRWVLLIWVSLQNYFPTKSEKSTMTHRVRPDQAQRCSVRKIFRSLGHPRVELQNMVGLAPGTSHQGFRHLYQNNAFPQRSLVQASACIHTGIEIKMTSYVRTFCNPVFTQFFKLKM